MKNLSNRVLTIASLCAFLSQTTQAQDTYWSMANNQVYNTKTGTLTTAGPAPLDYPAIDPKTVFSPSGNVLFCPGQTAVWFNGAPVSGLTGGRAAVPLPGASGCVSKYAVINTSQMSGPHKSLLDINILDVSSGIPTQTTGATINANGDFLHYDAVVGPKQPSGDHYYYFITATSGLAQDVTFIEQYTLHSDGSSSSRNYYAPDPTTGRYISNGTTHAKISNDGAYIAYMTESGTIMTFNTATQQYVPGPTFVAGSTPEVLYGLEGVNINGTVRWFLSLSNRFGYFDQGSTTFNQRSTSTGIKSDVALGPDGQIYVARGINLGGNIGDLLTFNPTIAGTQSPVLKKSACVYNDGTSNRFGNQINGENTNEVSSIYNDFTVNGGRGTLLNPNKLYTCTNFSLFDLTNPVQSAINLSIVQVDANDIPVTGGLVYGNTVPNGGLGVYDLKNLPGTNGTWLATHPGIYRITMLTTDACGRSAKHIEYVQVISATAIVDFLMIGPSDDNGTPVCNYLGTGFSGFQNRHLTTTFSTVGQVSTPPCVEGWVGASTLGIGKANTTGTTATPTGAYEIKVDEYDASGSTFIKNVLLRNPTSLASTNFTFDGKTTPLHYFSNSYETIKANNVYLAKVSMTTVECGTVSAYSYFKIINGGLSSANGGSGFPESWRAVEVPASSIVNVYPNPTTNNVHFAWTSNAEGKDASIAIIDVLGRVIYNQTMAEAKGSNDRLVDLSTIASGTYHYILKTSNGETSGTVVKQ